MANDAERLRAGMSRNPRSDNMLKPGWQKRHLKWLERLCREWFGSQSRYAPNRSVRRATPFLEPLEDRLTPATWVVNNIGDTGTADPDDATKGDFRYCLKKANAGDEIDFNLDKTQANKDGVTFTIKLKKALPTITQKGLIINATSQKDWGGSLSLNSTAPRPALG
jgi:hypothetical protein